MRFYGAKSSDLQGLHIFGQLGHFPSKKPGPKLKPKAHVVRYLHRVQPNHILVETENGTTQRIRAVDFRPYDPFKDPKITTLAIFHNTDKTSYDFNDYKAHGHRAQQALFEDAYKAHAAATAKHAYIPKFITASTPPPRTKAHAKMYPDASLWMEVIDI